MLRPINSPRYALSAAAELLSAKKLNFQDVEISGVSHKDADVEPGDIFLAFPGAKVHGAEFISQAKAKGAVAVLTDEQGAALSTELPTLVVSHVREAGASLAASIYRYPVRDMQSIGITGTNGKTTVTTLLYEIFMGVGRDTGLIGTVESRIGQDRIKSERTTPEAPELQALAAAMVERHMRHLVMEISSHSLELKRIMGSHFAIVGFTNLSQDHLDFHGDMESYYKAKAQLFTHEYAESGFINIDTPFGQRLFDESEIAVMALSRSNPRATWHFTEIHPVTSGVEFVIRGKDGVLIQSHTCMHGGFNLDNLLMAVAIAYEVGIDPLELASTIPTLRGAPGRLESINLGQPFKVFVDYAHSPDAVSSVLSVTREFTPGRLIAVLGCGGDRDTTKRPLMGSALIEGADVAVFTSDNPRSESPSSILEQMLGSHSLTRPSSVIEDRGEAIAYAISIAEPGDTVLVLGKGHEVGQEIHGVVTPFDDRIHCAQAIEARA
jgi:UDP-N-acetylmuramoyl-L-alanyl-D-glutamate--2,6-diaminopimelate ligase